LNVEYAGYEKRRNESVYTRASMPVEFFVGRLPEIKRLGDKVRDAVSAKRTQVAFMVGERGIGKTSLASFVRVLAERSHGVVSAHAFLGGANSVEEMTRRVFDHLLKENIEKPWFSKIKALFGRHIQEVGLFGVSVGFRAAQEDLQQLARQFPAALRTIVDQLAGEKQGLLIVLDDINGLATSVDFANWLKSVVDEIATSGFKTPVFILLVGLEERRRELLELQPSLARIFDTVEIKPWSSTETELFFENAFQSVGISIEKAPRSFMAGHTGGLPVLAHEIGDAVFRHSKGRTIDQSIAASGILDAAEIVGRKYLEPQVLHAVKSQRYKSILDQVGTDHFGFDFTRAELAAKLTDADRRVLDNFLRRMTELGVVARDAERGAGAYKFTNWLNYLYLWFWSGPDATETEDGGDVE
jgi:hypothetical protein